MTPSNDLLNTRDSISSVAVIGSATTPKLGNTAVTVLVALSATVPGSAVAGTWSETLKVQEPPAARLPPVSSMKSGVPSNTDPVPQTSFTGRLVVATRPGITASRSSSNAMSETASPNRLMRLNLRVTLPPGTTGSSVNSLLRESSSVVTVRLSVAGSMTTAGETPISATRELVVLA